MDCFPQEGPQTGAGAQCGEGAVEMKCYNLTTSLHPPSPCALGEKMEELGAKLSQARRLAWFLFLTVLLQYWFAVSLSFFSEVESVFPMTITGEWYLSSSPPKSFLCVFFPCPKTAEWERSLVGTWSHPRLTYLALLKEFAQGSPGIQLLRAPSKTWPNCRPWARSSSMSNRPCWWHCP